jgi:hypothetical protein
MGRARRLPPPSGSTNASTGVTGQVVRRGPGSFAGFTNIDVQIIPKGYNRYDVGTLKNIYHVSDGHCSHCEELFVLPNGLNPAHAGFPKWTSWNSRSLGTGRARDGWSGLAMRFAATISAKSRRSSLRSMPRATPGERAMMPRYGMKRQPSGFSERARCGAPRCAARPSYS